MTLVVDIIDMMDNFINEKLRLEFERYGLITLYKIDCRKLEITYNDKSDMINAFDSLNGKKVYGYKLKIKETICNDTKENKPFDWKNWVENIQPNL